MIDQFLDINSIDPKYWGKSGWIFINSIALTYKPEMKEKYKLFIQQLPYILPCKTCGTNLFKNMDEIDQVLTNKESLLNWLLKIRNSIYIEQNIPTKTLDDNINEIFSIRYSYSTNTYMIIITCSLILILIFFIFLFKKYSSD